jgi:hypothetical protein
VILSRLGPNHVFDFWIRRENLVHRLREPSELGSSINPLEELFYDRRTWIGEAQELIVVPVLMSATTEFTSALSHQNTTGN